MIIAKIDGQTITLGDMRNLFPNTSFPTTGPDDEWYVQNGCMKVNLSAPCNRETEELQPCEPYIVDNVVYTNKAVEKTELIIENTVEIVPTSSSADTITL